MPDCRKSSKSITHNTNTTKLKVKKLEHRLAMRSDAGAGKIASKPVFDVIYYDYFSH